MHAQPLSKIGVVLDTLVALCADVDDQVQVLDGPYVGELNAHVLVLGVPDGSTPGYRTTVTREQGWGSHTREDWSVHAMLSLTTGEDDVRALRDHAVRYIGALDAALRNVDSDDVWDRAALAGRLDWIPVLGPAGAAVTVFFDLAGSGLL